MSCVEHTLSPSDTLQGLAIKYGVKVADIRKANNMWAQDNIHLKKVLLIPSKVGAPVPDGAGSSPKKIHPRGDSLAPLNHVSPDLRPTSHLSRTPITAHTSAELREQQFANHDDLFSL